MTRQEQYELWRERVETAGGIRPALRAHEGMARTTLQELLRWGAAQTPESGYVIPEGHVIKGESVLLDPAGKVLAKWVKTREDGNDGLLIEALQSVFAKHDGKADVIPAPENSDADLLTLYPLADLHFGMYSWAEETGADYDINIAADIARNSIRALVAKSDSSKRAVLLGLGDLFHQNDQKNATPGSGHRLDVDGRWSRVFSEGAKLMTELVDLIAEKHEEIDIVLLPGNHDEDAAVCLRVALSLFYAKNPRIRVYSRPGLLWYARHGACLLGATHGHTMKPVAMALALATDCAKDWGDTKHRSFFFGHIHNESMREIGTVRVESFNTPASRDAWSQGGGYRSTRSMNAITFHAELGEIGRHRVNILAP